MFATNLYRTEAIAARNERLEGDILAQASDLKRDYDELERKKTGAGGRKTHRAGKAPYQTA